MKHAFSMHMQALLRALKTFLKQPLGSLLILVMLGMALTLPLAFYLLVQSNEKMLGQLTTEPQMTVFAHVQTANEDLQQLQQTLQQRPEISTVTYVPKDQALEELQQSMGEQDLVSILEENPLPDAYVLVIKPNQSPEQIQALQQSLSALPHVDLVQLDAQWIQTLHHINRLVQHLVWFLAVTLCVAFVLVAHNTIRLQILSQKEEIEITKLLGAPSSFVRRPFLYQAWWQGMLALGLSLALCAWLIEQSAPMLTNVLAPYGINMAWRFFTPLELGVLWLLMSVLAIVGAGLATAQHLRHFSAKNH